MGGTEIDVSKYFKTFRDDYGFVYAIETVGDERELIKEIKKQNEQLQQLNQKNEELKQKLEKIKEAIFNYQKTINNHYITGLNAQILKIQVKF